MSKKKTKKATTKKPSAKVKTKVVETENFGELISNFTFISRGKSKFLDCLYLIRQGHNERYQMKSGTNWVKSPNWNRSLQICVKSLSSIISKEDQIKHKREIQGYKKSIKEIEIEAALALKKLQAIKLPKMSMFG